MSEHTKEPWLLKQRGTGGVVDVYIGDYINGRVEIIGEIITRVNARRIIACVNACAGISTESLERGTPIIAANQVMAIQADEWKAERDELLAAAKNLRDVKGRHHSEQAFARLVEVVAKAEGA